MNLPPILRKREFPTYRRRWYVPAFIVAGVWAALFLFGRFWDSPIQIVNNFATGGIRALISGSTDKPLVRLVDDPDYQMPQKEPDRLDILLLGIRGKDDQENGGYLTDTILLLSIDERTGEASLVSLPRDFTVRITDTLSDKANTVYLRAGLSGSQRLFSRITGVYIDHVAVLDFAAFQAIVDALDGITVTLDEPFTETQQWGYEFTIPEGESTLNGEQALYYVRSRYSTSDFDRSRRQQQVIVAMKDRLSELGLLSNPITAIKLMNTLRKNVETDIDILDLGTIRHLASLASDTEGIRRYVIHSENLLYETMAGGVYRLLPRGHTLQHLKDFIGGLPLATVLPVIPGPNDPMPIPEL